MTEHTTSTQDIISFYDGLAPDYDVMTRFEERFIKEQPYYHLLVKKYNITTALDAGCGTGFHSLLLSRLGVSMTSVDISDEMLDRAKRHAQITNQNIRFIKSDFIDLPTNVQETFDAVFCLGNSLPHILTKNDLHQTLNNFNGLLNNNGLLFIQLLNYDHILKLRERVQNIRESDGKIFIRFYDYGDDSLVFNLLTLEHRGGIVQHTISSVPISPLGKDYLVDLLSGHGFTEVEVFGSPALLPYNPETSQDVFILTKKKA